MSETMPIWLLFLKTYPVQLIIGLILFIAFHIIYFLWLSRVVRNQEKNFKRRQNSVDGLTGLYNAETFRDAVRNHMVTVSDLSVDALLLFDADDMRIINENQGTLQGDIMLKEFSAELQKLFRSSDIIGRIESDCFAVYMKNVHSLDLVNKKCQTVCDGQIQLPVSIGGTMIQSREPFLAAFKRAQDALQEAKNNGKNRYCIA